MSKVADRYNTVVPDMIETDSMKQTKTHNQTDVLSPTLTQLEHTGHFEDNDQQKIVSDVEEQKGQHISRSISTRVRMTAFGDRVNSSKTTQSIPQIGRDIGDGEIGGRCRW